jgi:peptide/nickel transport system permease protein
VDSANSIGIEPFRIPAALRGRRSVVPQVVRRLARTRLTAIAFVVICIVVMCAIFAGVLAPYDPITSQSYTSANQGPSSAHWFGTDYLGRDTLSRLIYGARVSLLVALGALMLGLGVGVPVGLLAGWCGGKVDGVLMRVTDAIWAFPGLMLALAITSALGPGLGNVAVAIAIVNIPYFGRLARASTLATREMDFVTAARAMGSTSSRMITHHVLPNISAPLVVQGSYAFGIAIITEASLSFLGVGVQPPTPSWGIELHNGYQYMTVNPWLSIFPGIAIFATVMSFNLLGDGLRIALDPKMWQRAR